MADRRKSAKAIKVGDWVLFAERNVLGQEGQEGQEAREVRLEPRHADLLLFLSARQNQVVSTDELIEGVWQGQVVTDQSVYQAIAKLRKAVGDSASQPRYIETVAKRGYRLIAEVSEIATEAVKDNTPTPAASPALTTQPLSESRTLDGGLVRLSIAVAGLVLLCSAAWFLSRPAIVEQPEYSTVAVLPFDALSESDVNSVMAEGFSIELAHALGRDRRMRVIGPISAKLASTLGESPSDIGRHLNADIVVNGSIRRHGGALAVSSVVTEVETGHRLWSTVFDRSAQQILSVQREVASAVANALSHTVDDAEIAPQVNMPSKDILVYDEYLLGKYYRVRRTREDLERAVFYFQQALQRNPTFAPAVREMAVTHLLLSFYGDKSLADALNDAQPFIERAQELTPEDARLQALIGLAHYLKGAPGIAEEYLRRAVAEHPNLAEAWMWLGLAQQQQRRLSDALWAIERADTLEPLMITSAVNRAHALSWLGRDDEALALLTNLASTADEAFENRGQLYRALSGTYFRAGQLADAYRWAERALAINPGSALARANMALMLAALGQFDQAQQTAHAAYTQLSPGRGVLEYLELGNIVSPGLVPRDVIRERLENLQRLADTPEIEWRIANLDLGISAYFENDLDVASRSLRKAFEGRDYPIIRSDADIFYCTTLVDTLLRSGTPDEASELLQRCEQSMKTAKKEGWNSLTMAVSEVRLAVLRGDQPFAREMLSALFDRGFRDLPLLMKDPVLASLGGSEAYQGLLRKVTGAVEEAWATVSDAPSS